MEAKWTIFYDPHSRGKGVRTNHLVQKLCRDLDLQPVKCRPTPFFGKYSTESTLSYIDLVVANAGEKVARVLCEIEESGAPPKKIIGDIVNIFLADEVRIQGNDYNIEDMYLVLGIKVKERGKSAKKAENLDLIIQEKIPKLHKRIAVVCDDSIDKLIDKIEAKILGKL